MNAKTENRAQTEIEALFGDLTKPSLHGLSYVLRHPETWPKGFVWDYKHCERCAMGLAYKLWKLRKAAEPGNFHVGSSMMAQVFAMSYTDASKIFFDANLQRHYEKEQIIKTGLFGWGRGTVTKIAVPLGRGAITPDMVADDIDKCLAKAE